MQPLSTLLAECSQMSDHSGIVTRGGVENCVDNDGDDVHFCGNLVCLHNSLSWSIVAVLPSAEFGLFHSVKSKQNRTKQFVLLFLLLFMFLLFARWLVQTSPTVFCSVVAFCFLCVSYKTSAYLHDIFASHEPKYFCVYANMHMHIWVCTHISTFINVPLMICWRLSKNALEVRPWHISCAAVAGQMLNQ
jgi:hypothetical protein